MEYYYSLCYSIFCCYYIPYWNKAIATTTVKHLSWRPPPNNDHLSTKTTILVSRFQFLKHKITSEQRPPVNNGHKFSIVVVHRFDCMSILIIYCKLDCSSIWEQLRVLQWGFPEELERTLLFVPSIDFVFQLQREKKTSPF